MLPYYCVLLLLFGGGLISLALGSRAASLRAASFSMCAASALGLAATLPLLLDGASISGALPLPLPLGACSFTVDPLSAVFLLPVFVLSGISGLLLPSRMLLLCQENPVASGSAGNAHYGKHGFFCCLLSAGMVLTLIASDAVLFLIAWEVMSLVPFFLISPRDKDAAERHAAWMYLVAAHLGALPLLYLFAALTTESGSTGFFAFAAFEGWRNAGLLFLLALVGFGTKAGLVPLHAWIPEAHSCAPAHVTILLSGAILKLGLYGIMRVLTLIGLGDVWWAYALMGAGAFSGILAILLGLVQPGMKRTLAYSSSENIGIICLALGGAMLAMHLQAPTAAALLLAGVFLHIWSHAAFKSLLFLGANAVKDSTHTDAFRLLGGLQKRIPLTGSCMALGSAAIAGIPPLNGFMSELLIYAGFAAGSHAVHGREEAFLFWGGFFMLGAIAGMALFAFTRLFGLGFLGAPRSDAALEVREPCRLMQGALLFLAGLCVLMSLCGALLYTALTPLLHSFARRLSPAFFLPDGALEFGSSILLYYALTGLAITALFSLALLLRKRVVAVNGTAQSPTWDCGYTAPSARMQYSGGSFSHSLALLLRPLIRSRITKPAIQGLFPAEQEARISTPDWSALLWEKLIFHPVELLSDYAKGLQAGLVNIYILYIFITLILALAWALGWS